MPYKFWNAVGSPFNVTFYNNKCLKAVDLLESLEDLPSYLKGKKKPWDFCVSGNII